MNSWGILGKPTAEKVQEWGNMPYGKFKEMVADVKKQTKGKPIRKYLIEIQDIETSYKNAHVTVEAATVDQAFKLSALVDKNDLRWSLPKSEKNNKYSYRVSQIWD